MAGKLIIERDVMVPMRDGVKLATDVYRPDDDREHPVLVQLHPYNKNNAFVMFSLMLSPILAAERGYVVLLQQSRGRFKSEGTWWPFVHDETDSYDSVEWAACQAWSNGNVGMYGPCGLGLAAMQAAIASPPHLKAVALYMTTPSQHNGWVYVSGALALAFASTWIISNGAPDAMSRLNLDPDELQQLRREIQELADNPEKAFDHLPLSDIPAFRKVAPYWKEWLSHPSYDEYWKKFDAVANADRIKVPVLHMSGWYDHVLCSHLDLNSALDLRGDKTVRKHHRFIVGPWDHHSYLHGQPSVAGERNFGSGAATGAPYLSRLCFEWFDHWLMGKETTLSKGDSVRYFVMGENAWKGTDSWPPKHTPVPYYLHSTGHANSRFGDGWLSTEEPGNEPPDSYVYDPNDPVPATGGRGMGLYPNVGVRNQATIEERQDVLVYSSLPLQSPVSIAGPVSLTLIAASSAPDTDFTAKLVDVEPDGYCANIAEGIIRARYRNGVDKEVLLEPGQPTKFVVDLLDVAHVFKTGHRIRLDVSSSNFPVFDRNLNSAVSPQQGTAKDIRKANQQVFHRAEYLSYLALPLVP
ncbi:MAG: CocE/NonD family hydrolase [Chloroflexota bacterium]|nr:MAG: CocE/NonD family hydrolase [Chloroflexota bacterium]